MICGQENGREMERDQKPIGGWEGIHVASTKEELRWQACTLERGQRVRGLGVRVCLHGTGGVVRVKGVKVGKVGSRNRGAHVLKVGGEPLIQPQLSPVLHGHQVPKPLQT